MNLPIETLNQRGDNFLNFAGTMFWQTSLLIAILFGLDFLCRRKIRASIRYALWLVMLLKLVLPPTLALPTSPVWWLHKTPAAIQTKPQFQNFTVTYGSQPLPAIPKNLAVFTPPKSKLTISAWLLLISVFVSATLSVWLLVRWWQIARQARRATISERLMVLANEARRFAEIKSKSNLPVKLTTNTMSPAVCGLFRPVILIPQSLAEHFSDEQLHAVLLHELIHLRRRDVWVNFFQSLLQIIYWWQPLVWLANARIRRVREEAVDDAVMLALRGEAGNYAPTLLEVAKLALNRPLASLGLVGILESRSALRQRIERLLNFNAPKKAGLTVVSFLGILIFSAVAVPMGGAPSSPDEQNSPAPIIQTQKISARNMNLPSVLIQAGIYRMRPVDFENFEKNVSDLKFDQTKKNNAENFRRITDYLKSSGLRPIQRPRILTFSGKPAQFQVGSETNGIEFDCEPFVTNGLIELDNRFQTMVASGTTTNTTQFDQKVTLENHGGIWISRKTPHDTTESNMVVITIGAEIVTNSISSGRQKIVEKLNRIRLDQVHFENASLSEVLRQLSKDAKLRDSGHKGVNFLINPKPDFSGPPIVDPAAGLLITNYAHGNGGTEAIGLEAKITLNLTDVSLADVLDAVVLVSSKPIHYSVQDYAVMFSPPSTQLFERTFKVDANNFSNAVFNIVFFNTPNVQTNNVLAMDKMFFSLLGVNLKSPKGKAVFYNDRLGLLFVKATEPDLDTIERALQALNQVASQVHIKARFLEVPKGILDGMEKIMAIRNQTNPSAGMAGILTSKNFKTVLHTLEARKDVEMLAEPEAVTTSGRQTQMRATQVITVITNFVFQETATNSTVSPHTGQVETGPVFDTIPNVLSDGYTINLTAIASLTEFLGYEQTTNTEAAYTSSGEKVDLPTMKPSFQVQQAVKNLNLWDGQTLVMEGLIPPQVEALNEKLPDVPLLGRRYQSQTEPKRELVVFVTVDIVDPMGNRVHSDEAMQFAQTGIPPQPPKRFLTTEWTQ